MNIDKVVNQHQRWSALKEQTENISKKQGKRMSRIMIYLSKLEVLNPEYTLNCRKNISKIKIEKKGRPPVAWWNKYKTSKESLEEPKKFLALFCDFP